MDFKKLQERALEIRQKFGDYEQAQVGRRWSREDIMMGFMGDVGDLAKLVMAMEGKRKIDGKEAKIAHELADCLWSVLILAQMYEVDLEAAFGNTMDELETILNEKTK